MIQEKLDDEISLNFPELFVIGKYVKIKFKSKGSPYYFLSSSVYILGFIFDVVSCSKTD